MLAPVSQLAIQQNGRLASFDNGWIFALTVIQYRLRLSLGDRRLLYRVYIVHRYRELGYNKRPVGLLWTIVVLVIRRPGNQITGFTHDRIDRPYLVTVVPFLDQDYKNEKYALFWI